MKRNLFLFIFIICLCEFCYAGIPAVYFTDPFTINSNSVDSLDTKLCQYLNTAHDTILIAIYQFNLDTVGVCLKNLCNRGIKVKIIYDPNGTDVSFINNYLLKSDSVQYSGSAIMHHKFAIVDNWKVWTGSFNWTNNAAFRNNENAIIIEDTNVAQNFKRVFDKMFSGDFKNLPSLPQPEIMLNEGYKISTYFSPANDVHSAQSKIKEAMDNAKYSIYFCINQISYTSTSDISYKIVSRYKKGLTVKGILAAINAGGNLSNYDAYKLFKDNNISVVVPYGPNEFHHKFAVIDPGTQYAKVITGSYNWSNAAEKDNNENCVIIENPDVANYYFREFNKWYTYNSTPNPNQKFEITKLYNKPNPANSYTIFVYDVPVGTNYTQINIFTLAGEKVKTITNASTFCGGLNEQIFDLKNDYGKMLASGLYFVQVKVTSADGREADKVGKFLIRKQGQ